MARDLHTALKTETVFSQQVAGVMWTLVRMQWSKDDVAFSLHADPRTWTTAGIQTTDHLAHLGFHESACPYANGKAYCRWVADGFDVTAFGGAFTESYGALTRAERELRECGLFFEQSEGWAHFFGRRVVGSRDVMYRTGDGHSAAKSERMKETSDDNFAFVLTWLEGARTKGWTTHYRSLSGSPSPEVAGVAKFLGLNTFDDCPEFDFEPCFWRDVQFEASERGFFDSNADSAHRWFDAHATRFSPGVAALLDATRLVEPFGFGFIDLGGSASERREVEIRKRIDTSSTTTSTRDDPSSGQFDVAISFAGSERSLAEQLATAVREAGFRPFYDNFYEVDLWGKDLPVFFDDIYRLRSRYCVIFVSEEYGKRMWPNHERRSAQARALEDHGVGYVLPVRVDAASELPGMPPTVGYVSLGEKTIDDVATMLIEKLRSA